jgi:hypothetical protein
MWGLDFMEDLRQRRARLTTQEAKILDREGRKENPQRTHRKARLGITSRPLRHFSALFAVKSFALSLIRAPLAHGIASKSQLSSKTLQFASKMESGEASFFPNECRVNSR